MALRVVDTSTRAAVGATTTQPAQRDAMIAPFAADDVTVRFYAGGTLAETGTFGPVVPNSSTPRGWTLGPLQASTVHVPDATITHAIYRTAGGTDILRADAADLGLTAPTTKAGRRTNLADAVRPKVTHTAMASLPTGAATPTTATLSMAGTARTDVALAGTITLNAVADQDYTASLSISDSGTLSTAAPVVLDGTTSIGFTATWDAAGTGRTVTLNSMTPTLTVAGSPATVTVSDALAPGTITTIGTVTLYDYLGTVRTALAEGLSAADTRMQPRTGALAYCGATIWRDKYALPVLGGHGDSYDDGGYALDLATETWETLIPPSTAGTSSAAADEFGEYPLGTPGRPASQHTYAHLVTVGDDMIQVNGAAISSPSTGSKQAHRWNGTPGSWQRYGTNTGGISANGGAFCHYDATRNRLVRISLYSSSGAIDTMPADNPAADWTANYINSGNRTAPHDIGCAMGYHAALDCYVLISPGEFTPRNRVYVMDPDNFAAGWVSVTVSGEVPPALSSPGLEYCPPMQAMVTVDHTANNKLFYVKPTGTRTDPWVWSSEVFTGSDIQSWDAGAAFNGVYRRFVWSDYMRGFVVCKRAVVLPELYVPTEVAAYYDWQDRAAAAAAAGALTGRGYASYDFSEPPANGGTWIFGSLTEAPKVSVEVPWDSINYDTPGVGVPDHALDLDIYPPGSRASLRMTTRTGVFNATDQWRISIDEYSKQFREGDEFWVCWRTRMNAPYATHRFKSNDNGFSLPSEWNLGGYSEFKSVMFGYGMQYPNPPGTYYTSTRTSYGYSPGASHSDNVLAICATDCLGEIVMISQTDQMVPGGPAGWMKYPNGYIGKTFDGIETRGQNSSYFTMRNGGVETSGEVRLCEYTDPGGGVGNQYTNYSSCFIYPTDEWFSLMVHVVLGPQGTALQYGTGPSRTGYTASTLEYYGAYSGQPWSLLHRRSNLTMHSDPSQPGSSGVGRYGTFNWTTYITTKYAGDVHDDAIVWVSQIIVQPGSTMPAAPI